VNLSAVGTPLGVTSASTVAALFSVSDSLAELPWTPKFHLRRNHAGLEKVFQVAVGALARS
ncbi:MAG: hypothetical protein ACREMY_28830, partial [bacterium]